MYKEKYGLTLLITTINLEISLYTDFIYIIEQGKIALNGTPFNVLQKVIYASWSRVRSKKKKKHIYIYIKAGRSHEFRFRGKWLYAVNKKMLLNSAE